VLGFYFIWFPKNTVRMLAFLPPFVMQVFQVPARFVLGAYLVFDNLVPFLLAAGSGGVAHGAHIGGFILGAVAAWWADRRASSRPADLGAPEAVPRGRDAVRAALAAGELEEAARGYFALPARAARGALSVEEAIELSTWLRRRGHAAVALTLLRRVMEEAPRGASLAEVYALAGEILLQDLGQPTAAYQYLLTALQAGLPPQAAATVRRDLAAIEGQQKRRIGRLHAPSPWQ
jgi:hypothetical protein